MAVLRTASTTPRHHHQQMLIERPSRHVMIKTSFRSSVPATFLHTVTRFTGLSLSIRSEPPCLHIIIIISIIMIISGITIHIAITFLFASPGQASIGSPYPSPPPDHPPGFQSGMTRSKIANPASPPLPPPCPAVPPPSSPFARPTSLPPAGSLHACSD